MKYGRFHEIWQISWMKSGGYHEIQQISWMKFGGFHEIQQILWKKQISKCKILKTFMTLFYGIKVNDSLATGSPGLGL